LDKYAYPFCDANHLEDDIQNYFNEEITSTIRRLYRDTGNMDNYFGKQSIIKPPLDRRKVA
jgi:hypothetical protein